MADIVKHKGWVGSYVTLRASHICDLGLRGNALIAFSIIYGFASAIGECTSNQDYFEYWLGCSRQTATTIVHTLDSKNGLITIGKRRNSNGNYNNVYHLTEKAAHPKKYQNGQRTWKVDDATVTITGREVEQLGLRGRLLITFAVFFECLQDRDEHPVPLSYIAAWTGVSKVTARRYVRKLESMGYITRHCTYDENNCQQNVYRLSPLIAINDYMVPHEVNKSVAPTMLNATTQIENSVFWNDFQTLRSHVPTTNYFNCGFDRYKELRDRGLAHGEISHLVDVKRKEWRKDYPERSTKYAPRCQRILETIAVDLDDQNESETTTVTTKNTINTKPKTKAERTKSRPNNGTFIHALVHGGKIGEEANRLETARKRAFNNPKEEEKAEQAVRDWCDEHYDEIWDNKDTGKNMKGALTAWK